MESPDSIAPRLGKGETATRKGREKGPRIFNGDQSDKKKRVLPGKGLKTEITHPRREPLLATHIKG